MSTVAGDFDLSARLKSIAAIEEDLGQLVSVVTEGQFHAPPRSGGWSIGHCIEHLVLSGMAFVACWDEGLQSLSPASHNYRSGVGWLSRFVIWRMEPPYRFKARTSRALMPCSRRSRDETLARFHHMHAEMVRRVELSHELKANGIDVQVPVASWLPHPLVFSIDLALAHERRHLWQAREVRRQLLQPNRIEFILRDTIEP
jgi:hypothetical protein